MNDERGGRVGRLVPSGVDLFGQRRQVFGRLPIDMKVVGGQTGGGLLVLEQIDDGKGGPPRHVHLSQDEWFYVLQGHYRIEVGEDRYELGAGDSVLAPRGIAHVWAHVGDGIGRMLVEFHPAGAMEAFFVRATRLGGVASGPEMSRLFADHGMQLVGPPLEVE